MDRHRLKNAHDKVYGYYLPSPTKGNHFADGEQAAFLAAQAECLQVLQEQAEDIAALTFEQFKAIKNGTDGRRR